MALDVNPFADYGNLDFAKDNTFANTKQVFVELWADGQLHLPAKASTKVFGVLRDPVAKGEVPVVRRTSTAYVYAGGDLTVGEYVTTDEKGHAIKAEAGQIVLGEVLDKDFKAGSEAKINLLSQAAKVA